MRIQFILAIAILLISASLAVGASRSVEGVTLSTEHLCVRAHNQDDIWAVIEYPEGQEVVVELAPTSSLPSASGTARVMRNANGTDINLELTGLNSDAEYYAYAIDSLGNATSLGMLTVAEGKATLSAQSALTKLMLLISPKDDVVTLTAETPIVLRSRVPEGFQIVARGNVPEVSAQPTATTTEEEPSLVSEYEVPLLGIGSLKRATQMTARLFDETQGSRMNASVKPGKKGVTEIKFVIKDLKPAPEGKNYIAWAVGPQKEYSALGHIAPGKQSKLDSTIEFQDFGIFITLEDSESPPIPAGKMVAMFIR